MSFIHSRPVATYDFYKAPHKGLRLAESQMLARLGACDGAEPEELAALLRDLVSLLHMAEHHLENEDKWIHTALEVRAPGATNRLVRDHLHHRETFEQLEALIGQVETVGAEGRGRALHSLYLRFVRFMADDFAHMAEEEELMMPVLQSLFSDEELVAIEGQIVAGLSPQEKVSFGRFMIPAATPADRIAFLGGVRANAPAEAFQAMIELSARPSLSPRDFTRLCEGLGRTG